jgi:hypothetical protein
MTGEIIYLEQVEKQNEIDEEIVVEDFARYTITTTLEDLINQHPNELLRTVNPDLDYSEFDFERKSNIEQSQYLHASIHKTISILKLTLSMQQLG